MACLPCRFFAGVLDLGREDLGREELGGVIPSHLAVVMIAVFSGGCAPAHPLGVAPEFRAGFRRKAGRNFIGRDLPVMCTSYEKKS